MRFSGGACVGLGQQGAQVLHHLGILSDRMERRDVRIPPIAQDQALGLDHGRHAA